MAQEVDEIHGRDVEEDMLEAEERGEGGGTDDVAAGADVGDGDEEEAKEKAIVLEVDVVDHEEARVEERHGGHEAALERRLLGLRVVRARPGMAKVADTDEEDEVGGLRAERMGVSE